MITSEQLLESCQCPFWSSDPTLTPYRANSLTRHRLGYLETLTHWTAPVVLNQRDPAARLWNSCFWLDQICTVDSSDRCWFVVSPASQADFLHNRLNNGEQLLQNPVRSMSPGTREDDFYREIGKARRRGSMKVFIKVRFTNLCGLFVLIGL